MLIFSWLKSKLQGYFVINLVFIVTGLFITVGALFLSDYFNMDSAVAGYSFYEGVERISGMLPAFYLDNLRGDFFAAFFSVGAFLLSLKTFIVLTMKKELYDTDKYKKIWDDTVARGSVTGSIYKPLGELNNCLYWAIMFSITTAIYQASFGFLQNGLASFLGLWLAIVSCLYMVYCLFLVKNNLDNIIS